MQVEKYQEAEEMLEDIKNPDWGLSVYVYVTLCRA